MAKTEEMSSQNGWIKLHRKIIDSRVFQNEGLFKVWMWCLLRANHVEVWVPVKSGKGSTEVHLLPGQFIFGRHSAAKQLRMNPETVRKRMQKLKNMQNVTIESTNQFSIITIVNWDSYQSEENKSTSESTSQVPAKYHRQECKEVIIYLNKVSGRPFKHTDTNYRLIGARLNEGHTVKDCKLVIEHKLNDSGFERKYLRPSTLFQASKFDGYLADAKENRKPIVEKVPTNDPV